ncbi:MAG: C4-type zinc ribbon domain-containing protein [Geobacteraceae bacterium]|nr:C4-type zinc ribbon domain-containing protein [Geobacteraceae bacterium]
MGKNVMILAQLQEIDLKIDSSRGEKQSLMEEIAFLQEKVGELKRSVAGYGADLDLVEEEKRALEENLAAETDAISRSEGRLREIKTQKEYQAVSKEIAAAKKVKTELEDQILVKISRIEELKSAIVDQSKALDEFEASASSQENELKEKVARLETAIGSELESREATAKQVSPSMMKRYDKLRERRQGVAVAEARSGSCLGCNMNLPPQVFNSLFKADNMVPCPHCQRLLFLRQEGQDTQDQS